MPRLTNKQYLKHHKRLRYYWRRRQQIYGCLTLCQQHHLHAYFRPTETLPEEQLLQHRKDITARQPSLPHQAGKALKRLTAGQPRLRPLVPTAGRQITVRAIARKEIDEDKLAMVFLMMAMHDESDTAAA